METDAPGIPQELRQEVRVAMALNGGISLAIWMGGCAVELDAARRAHRGIELLTPLPSSEPLTKTKSFLTGLPPAPRMAGNPPAAGTRTMYNAICKAFGRELVIDLMSGASAGGINGALLSCAIAHERRLQPNFLRTKWLQLGDLSILLQRTSNPGPRSLMRGRMFHRELSRTFGALALRLEIAEDAAKAAELGLTAEDFALTALPPDQPPEEPFIPLLDVTTTNLVGAERTFEDQWHGTLVAREYRARFAFRRRKDYTAENLATAARSSASFPFAFEPWAVEQVPAELAGLPSGSFVVDGGLLDNAPIKAVLDLIPERAASRQVSRYVCYLNADPPLRETVGLAKAARGSSKGEDAPPVASLTLLELAGKCLGLPRKAPFVDQLDAIERRTRLAEFAVDSELGLLRVSDESLRELAERLLPAYRRRRIRLSLDELFVSPSEIRELLCALGDGACLPWVPTQVAEVGQSEWGWGLRAAQRVIHLLLDAIRVAVEDAQKDQDPARLRQLLDVRATVYGQQARITECRLALAPESELSNLVRRLVYPRPFDQDVCGMLKSEWSLKDKIAGQAVQAATRAVAALKGNLAVSHQREPRNLEHELFGRRQRPDDKHVESFIARALHIEVIRRSFDDERAIDNAQLIRFVQLTPCTNVEIFTRHRAPDETPERRDTPHTPEDKLAGIRLGHFASFYRSAWRANDFMWGRLDASARIVQLLVDPARAAQLHRQNSGYEPWTELARCILPKECTESDDRVWLVRETLGARATPDSEADRRAESVAELHDRLVARLREDLLEGEGVNGEERGRCTVTLCARAVQLEILQDELKILDEASTQDRLAGASSTPLGLPLADGRLRGAIEILRPDDDAKKPSLPARLAARGEMEIASTLGLRTATHVLFVALAALRHAKIPFAKALYILRALLFPVMGAVSRVGWYRAVVVIGFWGSALYLTSRILAMPPAKWNAPAALEDAVSRPVLLSYIALLAIIGVAVMPALRAWSGGSVIRRITQALWVIALLAVGVGLVVGLAFGAGDLTVAQLLVAAGTSAGPPKLLQSALIAVVFGLPLLRLMPGVRGKIADWLDGSRWTGAMFAGAFAVLAGWLVAWAIFENVGGFLDGGGPSWKVVAAWTAFAGAPLVVGVYLALSFISDKVKRP